MAVGSHRRFMLLLCGISLAVLATSGCCPRCGSRCTPQGPWQSPTIQATRALLVVNTEELHILRIDGRNVHASCLGEGGVREYHIPAGRHTITATFRYAAPVYGGLIGAVRGTPLTRECQFQAGHEYVPIYREHVQVDASETRAGGGGRYWSLEIADLAEVRPDPEPEVREARQYCAFVRGPIAMAERPESSRIY